MSFLLESLFPPPTQACSRPCMETNVQTLVSKSPLRQTVSESKRIFLWIESFPETWARENRKVGGSQESPKAVAGKDAPGDMVLGRGSQAWPRPWFPCEAHRHRNLLG